MALALDVSVSRPQPQRAESRQVQRPFEKLNAFAFFFSRHPR